MRPMISNTPYYMLNIPDLSGGVNLRDGISEIRDNQLLDAENVWYKDGMLRTRPGLSCFDSNKHFDSDCISYSENRTRKIYIKKENYRVIDGKTYVLTAIQSYTGLVFRYYAADGESLEVASIAADGLPQADYTCNIFQHGTDIYCFCSGYYDNPDPDNIDGWVPYYIYKISEVGTDAAPIAFEVKRVGVDEDVMPYVPTVLINGVPSEGFIDSVDKMISRGASLFEGYNLIGNKYRMLVSNALRYETALNGEDVKDFMKYTLLYNTKDFIGQTVTATIKNLDGTLSKHSLKITGDLQEEEKSDDGLLMRIAGFQLWFMNAENGSIAQVSRSEYIQNSIEIIAPCPNPRENYEKVLNMDFNEWFGGSAEGLYGGIHLFMGGNKGDEKSLICWSDFNEPLYFNENNYIYVGDKSQAVTAFGKQGEALIIFKEKETYATTYNTSDTVSAEEVINQSVVDVVASSTVFPMAQVHGFIGCDCPDTVELCRNRLVWANTDGKIYTLTSASQWTERSIFEISGMVNNKIKKHTPTELRGARSADYDGYYFLFVGQDIYVMDYNSYGFTNIYSYTKSEDAEVLIPWWLWRLPKYKMNTFYDGSSVEDRYIKGEMAEFDVLSVVAFDNSLCVWGMFRTEIEGIGGFYTPEMLVFNGKKDMMPDVQVSQHLGQSESFRERTEKTIPTRIQTKFFDFGTPTVKKTVPKIMLVFCANGGEPIYVTENTDNGSCETVVAINKDSISTRDPESLVATLIRPAIKNIRRIALTFETKGYLAIESMTLQYKKIGGLK